MENLLKTVSALALSFLLVLSSCSPMNDILGSDNIQEVNYDYEGFNSIDISNAFQVEIIQSEEYKVTVKCNDNLMEHLEVSNKNGTLSLGLSGNTVYNNVKLSATIHLPRLNSLITSGASDIKTTELNCDNLTLDISGASDVYGEFIVSNNLKIKANGASSFHIKGRAKTANLTFKGASSFKGKNMIIDKSLNLKCSGASDISITTNGEMDLDLSGASSLSYSGKGVITNQNISGASSVKKN